MPSMKVVTTTTGSYNQRISKQNSSKEVKVLEQKTAAQVTIENKDTPTKVQVRVVMIEIERWKDQDKDKEMADIDEKETPIGGTDQEKVIEIPIVKSTTDRSIEKESTTLIDTDTLKEEESMKSTTVGKIINLGIIVIVAATAAIKTQITGTHILGIELLPKMITQAHTIKETMMVKKVHITIITRRKIFTTRKNKRRKDNKDTKDKGNIESIALLMYKFIPYFSDQLYAYHTFLQYICQNLRKLLYKQIQPHLQVECIVSLLILPSYFIYMFICLLSSFQSKKQLYPKFHQTRYKIIVPFSYFDLLQSQSQCIFLYEVQNLNCCLQHFLYIQMSQEGESPRIKQAEQDDNDLDAENLFNEVDAEQSEKESQKKPKKLKKIKKDKKSKKDKKKKKKKRREEQDQQQYDFDEQQEDDDQERNSMFEEEAESDDEENYSQDRQAQIGQEEENDRFNEMMNKPSTRDQYFRRFEGKNDREINAQYSRGATMLRENEAMYPGQSDPKIYIVNVKPRHEDELVLCLLNKAKHLAQTANKITVVTATSMRKKYPGRIFVEAFSEKDLRDSLEGFNFVILSKSIHQLDREGYAELFNQKHETKVDFQQSNFVRITKGLYEGDLAQIFKIKANSVDVFIVPRLNVQQIAMKIREQTSKIMDEKLKQEKKAELLTLFLNYKSNNFKKRPIKQPVTRQEIQQEFGDNPASKKIRLADKFPGLLILNYRFDEITKPQGTYLPVEIMPFTTEGNFIGKMNEEKGNFTTATSYKKGQEIQIIAGSMVGHKGVIFEVLDNIAIIVCKDKQLKNEKIEEPLENIVKKFKQGQRVKVISGADTGKTGIVLKVQDKVVELWTDNQNSIRVNKKNLQVTKQQIICEENVHNLKKDDLIKTSKNQIGIVIETTKDNIKMLDTNNTIQIVNNMDFDSKLNTRNIVAKNRSGDEISAGSLVIIRQGIHQGKKCKVIHVYRQNVFLFNATFNRTAGISVQNAENCSLISKNEPANQRNISIKGNQSNFGASDKNEDEITIGKKITLRSGPLKGYQGIVKSINKDKIQVRVLSKACTEWVPRQNVTAKQQAYNIGKTPNRRVGNTHNYVPSPTRY